MVVVCAALVALKVYVKNFFLMPVLVFMLLGVSWTSLHLYSFYPNIVPYQLQKRSLSVIGVIDSFPVSTPRGVLFTLRIEQLTRFVKKGLHKQLHSSVNFAKQSIKGRLKLGWYVKADRSVAKNTPPILQPGQRWQLEIQVKQPNGFRNQGSFDYEQWLFRQKIIATGQVKRGTHNKKLADNAGSLLLQIRHHFDQRLRQLLHSYQFTKNHIALIRALALGERSMISVKQWQVLRQTGTAHLVAISGLHIGLAASFMYVLARFCWSRFYYLSSRLASHKLAAGAAIIAAFSYAALAGFSIPTQRALLMTLILMLALIYSIKIDPGKLVCIALLAVLGIDPLAILDSGFWLSFIAVAFIFFAAPLIHRKSKLIDWLGIQFLLLLCLAPLSIHYFQTVTLIGPIANMIVIPVISLLVVPLILLACVFLFISQTIAAYLLLVTSLLLHICWVILEYLFLWFPALTGFGSRSLSATLLAFIGIIVVLIPCIKEIKILAAFLFLPLLSPALLFTKNTLGQGEILMTVLDSGQGLAVVVKTASQILVYDVGARFSEHFDIGNAVIVPYLNMQGVSDIDWVIISHKDNDHRGGFESVAKVKTIKHLLSGSPQSLKQFPVKACVQGQRWRVDEVSFSVLHPHNKDFETGNNRSCVVLIKSRFGSILLTGDIHREAEQRIYERSNIKADVLVVPHHGSKTSSSWAFLRQVNPTLAIVSAGFQNRFGHPSKVIMKRYSALKIKVLNTAKSGSIELKIGKSGQDFRIRQYRLDNHRFWHRK
ncbi:DNA internalization-related competence protein ComEC/Rec2 [hydrothermal vent metagenome]|uniref:DNA internalization-related competence protein ComEC/Rec2 n=1 Tax=hydrothermal vent metagenome TaxID=652676 RepID=A0A3B0YZU5_9ZZZZ